MDRLTMMQKTYLQVERMKLLRDLALIDAEEELIYDRFTQIASEVIDAPVSLVSMVASNYQFFKSIVGLPDPWASRRRTSLSHSFCQHVVNNNKPLIVTDAREIDFLKDNQAIPDLKVVAYLGIPIQLFDQRTLGSFCMIDSEPREWTQLEIDIMTEIAALISYEFDKRAMARMDKIYQPELDKLHEAIYQFFEAYEKQTDISQQAFLVWIRDWRKKQGI